MEYLGSLPKDFDKGLLALVSFDAAKKYSMAPYKRTGDTLYIAMLNPQNFEALNVLRFLAEKEQIGIEITLTNQGVLDEIFKQYGGTDTALKEAIQSLQKEEATNISEAERKKGGALQVENYQDAPIAKLVDVIVQRALDGRASDIHIEPIEKNYRVRFRIDGILRAELVFPEEVGRGGDFPHQNSLESQNRRKAETARRPHPF
ncbi:MAG: hypothetical protein WDN67_00875 [Candidatus Moraniibacteriota bacterium]